MGIACRVATIDGLALTMDEAGRMELIEANPITEIVAAAFLASLQSKGVS